MNLRKTLGLLWAQSRVAAFTGSLTTIQQDLEKVAQGHREERDKQLAIWNKAADAADAAMAEEVRITKFSANINKLLGN